VLSSFQLSSFPAKKQKHKSIHELMYIIYMVPVGSSVHNDFIRSFIQIIVSFPSCLNTIGIRLSREFTYTVAKFQQVPGSNFYLVDNTANFEKHGSPRHRDNH